MSSARTNALVSVQSVQHKDVIGFGEAGLPPKKQGVYLAELNDVVDVVRRFIQTCSSQSLLPAENTLDTIAQLLHLLDDWITSDSCRPEGRAGSGALECALLDLEGKLRGVPVYTVLSGYPEFEGKCPRVESNAARGFMTVGIEKNPVLFQQVLEEAVRVTPFLKFKADDDLGYIQGALLAAREICSKRPDRPWAICVDANSCWTPAIGEAFLCILEAVEGTGALHGVVMLEQPMPVVLPGGRELEQWRQLFARFLARGVCVFADESVATPHDVEALAAFGVHGVNVKLDKAGGVRQALRALLRARELGLRLWLGCMVSSALSCSTAAHLLGTPASTTTRPTSYAH